MYLSNLPHKAGGVNRRINLRDVIDTTNINKSHYRNKSYIYIPTGNHWMNGIQNALIWYNSDKTLEAFQRMIVDKNLHEDIVFFSNVYEYSAHFFLEIK